MRIVFMGSPDFAIPSLEQLHQSSHQITAVVSGKDKRRGRGAKPSPTPVKAKAQELDLSVIEVERLDDPSFINRLEKLQPDLFVVVAFRILPPDVLAIPTKGSVNLHASLLPKYRGAAPIHWAVMNGETETGCTIFWLEEDVDTGKIIMQQSIPIYKNETTGDVYGRLKILGSKMMTRAVDSIGDGTWSSRPQDESEVSAAPKLFDEDCKIDFNQPPQKIHNKIRGLSPFPTAWAMLDDLRLNLYRSRVGPAIKLRPGEMQMNDDHLLVGCASGTVILDMVQLEGKKKMSGYDFMNGYSGTGMLH